MADYDPYGESLYINTEVSRQVQQVVRRAFIARELECRHTEVLLVLGRVLVRLQLEYCIVLVFLLKKGCTSSGGGPEDLLGYLLR